MAYRLSLIIIALWAGALWTTGVSAYVLFDSLQDKQLAGSLAGKLFTVVSYIGLVSAFYLLVYRLVQFGTPALKQSFFWAVFFMLLLVLAGHFGIQHVLEGLKAKAFPADVMQSVFADRFKTWHGVASMAYLIECILAIVMVLKAR
ncbi:MAG: DUF4149 domain-containing protein [Methylotenera sp.]|jgi:cytochrome bd-type quinol oxidase subunit 1|nr:DUF4149 domain-containing protein [Methylotenera sp.]MDD4925213.1 DUF4149 domain-containing protein [Methylotenera sp.]MDO9282339.1 DUF4149 domain-containing protein [Methylotenera sp.]NOS95609.1 DUF4149 domain-containing protein [Methylotenera sp.]NOU39683.1 DUF4149 domain-containing protein [Methylotenera sp.]